MFDLDASKMLVVAVVALVVVGPKELPVLLRTLGKAAKGVRDVQSKARTMANTLLAEADLDGIGRDVARVRKDAWSNIALSPALAMRGTLPPASGIALSSAAPDVEAASFSSPEMAAYLTPPAEPQPSTPNVAACPPQAGCESVPS